MDVAPHGTLEQVPHASLAICCVRVISFCLLCGLLGAVTNANSARKCCAVLLSAELHSNASGLTPSGLLSSIVGLRTSGFYLHLVCFRHLQPSANIFGHLYTITESVQALPPLGCLCAERLPAAQAHTVLHRRQLHKQIVAMQRLPRLPKVASAHGVAMSRPVHATISQVMGRGGNGVAPLRQASAQPGGSHIAQPCALLLAISLRNAILDDWREGAETWTKLRRGVLRSTKHETPWRRRAR